MTFAALVSYLHMKATPKGAFYGKALAIEITDLAEFFFRHLNQQRLV